MTNRPFRFGVVAAMARTGDEWLARARQIESLGYAVLAMPDGLRYTLAPFPALGAAAAATTSLRIGTYVLANDFRNPVLVAKEAATLDLVSGGRFELGLGAGRPGAESDNHMLGLAFDPGSVRLAKLGESLRVIKTLLAGAPSTASGSHYQVQDAEITPLGVQKPGPPILVAGAGKHLLSLAARAADIVALGIPPHANESAVAEKVAWLREAAGERFDHIELNINLMAVGDQVPRYLSSQMGISAADLASGGSVAALVGDTEAMCATLLERRERLGISYIMVSDELMQALAPVVERLAGR